MAKITQYLDGVFQLIRSIVCHVNQNILIRIVFTDESIFIRDGIYKVRHAHIWMEDWHTLEKIFCKYILSRHLTVFFEDMSVAGMYFQHDDYSVMIGKHFFNVLK